jgi:hypothetical protein
MKAAVVPAMSSSWQIQDVPQPQPGPSQVLVKMRQVASAIPTCTKHSDTFQENFPESSVTSRSARSWPCLPMSQRGR